MSLADYLPYRLSVASNRTSALVSRSYQDRFDITLRLENLTNAQPLVSRRPFGARPYRPFMVQVGVEVDL